MPLSRVAALNFQKNTPKYLLAFRKQNMIFLNKHTIYTPDRDYRDYSVYIQN